MGWILWGTRRFVRSTQADAVARERDHRTWARDAERALSQRTVLGDPAVWAEVDQAAWRRRASIFGGVMSSPAWYVVALVVGVLPSLPVVALLPDPTTLGGVGLVLSGVLVVGIWAAATVGVFVGVQVAAERLWVASVNRRFARAGWDVDAKMAEIRRRSASRRPAAPRKRLVPPPS